MSNNAMSKYPTRCEMTPADEEVWLQVKAGMMTNAVFFAHLMFDQVRDVIPTRDVPYAATDGSRIWWNPDAFRKLMNVQRVFIMSHEIAHIMLFHMDRHRIYSAAGMVGDLPYDGQLMNVATDLSINQGLKADDVGAPPPTGCFSNEVEPWEQAEEVYRKLFQGAEKGKGPSGRKGQIGSVGTSGEGFDEHLPPPIDPATGVQERPNPETWKQAIASAASAAKAQGNLPAGVARMVDHILAGTTNWKEYLRFLVGSAVRGALRSWRRINRRGLVRSPMAIMPGRTGYSAGTIAVVVDSSGSITEERELPIFLGEMESILTDTKPRRLVVIFCDAAVQKVEILESVGGLAALRAGGIPGGGGTSFVPPFHWLRDNGITPDALVYLTDCYGDYPDEPAYPVIWASTTSLKQLEGQPHYKPPFGTLVHINLDQVEGA